MLIRGVSEIGAFLDELLTVVMCSVLSVTHLSNRFGWASTVSSGLPYFHWLVK